MTTEQKAKAYDEAVKVAKSKIKNDKDHILYEGDVIEMFPELKEPEDERIRKEMIEVFKSLGDGKIPVDINYADIFTWLKRQGDKFQYWKPSEDQLEAIDYAYNLCPDTERGNYYEGILETLINDLHKLSEKQGEQNLAKNGGKMSENTVEKVDMTEYNKGFECGKQRVLRYPEDYGLCKKLAWSEEDKGNLLEVKCIIDEIWNSQYIRGELDRSSEELESLWHWLDDIWQRIEYHQERYTKKNKTKKVNESWKPSKEQMDLLREVQQALLGKDCHNRFVNFMYELKQLM